MYEHICLAIIGLFIALFFEESLIKFLGILSFVLNVVYIGLDIFGGF